MGGYISSCQASSIKPRIYFSSHFPIDSFVEIDVDDNILEWDVFVDVIRDALVVSSFCPENTALKNFAMNTVCMTDGDIDTPINTLNKLRRHFANCEPYKHDLKLVMSFDDHLTEGFETTCTTFSLRYRNYTNYIIICFHLQFQKFTIYIL